MKTEINRRMILGRRSESWWTRKRSNTVVYVYLYRFGPSLRASFTRFSISNPLLFRHTVLWCMYRFAKPRVHFYIDKTQKSCHFAKKGKISEARIRNATCIIVGLDSWTTGPTISPTIIPCGVTCNGSAFVISHLSFSHLLAPKEKNGNFFCWCLTILDLHSQEIGEYTDWSTMHANECWACRGTVLSLV